MKFQTPINGGTSKKLAEEIKDIDDYAIYSRLQLCLNVNYHEKGNYWIPDFMFVREVNPLIGASYLEVIIVDAKLSGTTGWTKNQGKALLMDEWTIKSINDEKRIFGDEISKIDKEGVKLSRIGEFIKLYRENNNLNSSKISRPSR